MIGRRLTHRARPLVHMVGSFRGKVAIALGCCVIAGAAGGGVALSSAGGLAVGKITVSSQLCAPGWVAPRSGQTVFTLTNTDPRDIYAVELIGLNAASVFGEVQMLAPGTSDSMVATLPPGQYAFECDARAGFTTRSAFEQVKGPPVGAPAPYIQLSPAQIAQATLEYNGSLMPVMKRLERETTTLAAAVSEGRLAQARTLWLPAHLDYARLGAAYDTFGNFDVTGQVVLLDAEPAAVGGYEA